MILEIQAEVIE